MLGWDVSMLLREPMRCLDIISSLCGSILRSLRRSILSRLCRGILNGLSGLGLRLRILI